MGSVQLPKMASTGNLKWDTRWGDVSDPALLFDLFHTRHTEQINRVFVVLRRCWW